MNNAFEIKNLYKSYKNFKLENLNLTLPCGYIMGLIGENGAGKSTTIKLMLNMIKKEKGSITLLGHDNQKSIELIKEDIGVVLDEIGIPGCLDAIKIEKVMKSIYKNWQTDVFFNYLNQFNILKTKPFKDYSRGMKMKCGIAIALSHRARLLILDEPTSGLDPVARDEVVDILNDFTRDENHSILISSHIVSDLEKLCDYIAFLHQGKLLLCEEKDSLIEKYGIINCNNQQLTNIKSSAIIGTKETPYGSQAIVKRTEIPNGMDIGSVSIEELFVFMVKEVK